MSSGTPRSAIEQAPAVALPDAITAATALWLTATTALALIAFYFVGFDQGAVSVFGADTHVHEFLHDARHVLGFPCH